MHDERLSVLLSDWRAIEPRDGFEEDVWRRIRTAPASESPAISLVLEWLLSRPAWAAAMAMALGVLLGVGAGFSVPKMPGGNHAGEPLLHRQTLAGSYLTMVAGASR